MAPFLVAGALRAFTFVVVPSRASFLRLSVPCQCSVSVFSVFRSSLDSFARLSDCASAFVSPLAPWRPRYLCLLVPPSANLLRCCVRPRALRVVHCFHLPSAKTLSRPVLSTLNLVAFAAPLVERAVLPFCFASRRTYCLSLAASALSATSLARTLLVASFLAAAAAAAAAAAGRSSSSSVSRESARRPFHLCVISWPRFVCDISRPAA